MEEISLKKRIRGWMAFDWATQPFYTLGLTFIFGPYFAGVSFEYFSTIYADEETAKATSQATWFWGQTIAGLLIALTAPLIGAYADSTGRRMPWILDVCHALPAVHLGALGIPTHRVATSILFCSASIWPLSRQNSC